MTRVVGSRSFTTSSAAPLVWAASPGRSPWTSIGQPSILATMMTPLIMFKDNRVRAVLGSGGSTRIRTVILQLISNLIDFGFWLERAVERPRVHYQDGILQCEQGYSDDVRSVLEKIGYQVRFWDYRSIYFGGAHCVGMGSEGSTGAGDPRRGGATSFPDL